MVRKQLYIGDEHERALKARARVRGITEAELVRRMLNGLLLDEEGEGLPGLALRRHWKPSWRRPGASRPLRYWRGYVPTLDGLLSRPRGKV